jgi:hypothetical protein
VGGAFGDNDPIDVVEIGSAKLAMGSITAVKPIGVLSMIDDGELDWKVIAINAADPMAAQIHDVADLEAKMPGVVSGIREWFRWYKTPDDKPLNGFGHGEKCLGAKASARASGRGRARGRRGARAGRGQCRARVCARFNRRGSRPPRPSPSRARSTSLARAPLGSALPAWAQEAVHVIEETHGFYKDLISGKTPPGKLWIPKK